MDGVTILNTYEEFIPNGIIMIVLLCLAILLISLFVYMVDEGVSLKPLLATGMICVAMIFCIISFAKPYSFAGRKITHYQVTIDDSVKYTEFISHYKIISQTGQLFDVVEKTEGND